MRYLILSLLLAAGLAQAQETIFVSAVRFEGNERTREQVMLQEMSFSVGEPVPMTEIERSRQAIMDLGLFQWVEAHMEPSDEGHIVVYSVKEKFYILPMPILNGDPQQHDFTYGLELRFDNVAGLNQRVRLLYQQDQAETDSEVPHRRRTLVAYSYPRVLGGPYTFNAAAQVNKEEVNAIDDDNVIVGEYRRNILAVGGGFSRWLNIEGPSAGWRGGLGLAYQGREHRHSSGQPDFFRDSQSVSLTAGIGYAAVHDHGFYLSGSAYGWSGELGLPALRSDYSFARNLFYYRVYHRIPEQTANLNWQLRLGFAEGEVFGVPSYSLGGFSTLRGYETAIRGNAYALSNIEYHKQIDGIPALRGLLFLDVGNAYGEITDMEPGNLEAGLGAGLRWKVQFLVDVVVSADIAYGLGPGTQVIYLGTAGTF